MWRQNLNVGNGFLERLEDVFVEDAAAAAKKKKKKKDKMEFLQMRFALTCSKTQLSFDWWYLPSIILPFWVYNPRNNHRQTQAFCVFLKFCQIKTKFLKLQHRTQKAIFLPEQKDWLLEL